MRALHVIAGLDPSHGGPSYSVPRLCAELAAIRTDVRLFHVENRAGEPRVQETALYERRGFSQSWSRMPLLRGMRLSAGLDGALDAAARAVDVVHNHGIWLAPNMQAYRAAVRAEAPFVCSPRGMLSPEALAFSRLKKRLAWALGQRAALAGAACLHATSDSEHADIRACGLKAPVAMVPNGVDVPPPGPVARSGGPRTLLSLGRIHPKKGLDMLLHAWRRIEDKHPDWRLRIVGPAERGHDAELRALAERLQLRRVAIDGAVYGEAKLALYRKAALFALPTRSENFGMTVAEALAAGTPVVCAKGAPWAGVVAHACGWWVDHGADPFSEALDEAMSLPPAALAAMGQNGRVWMDRDYSWRRVAEDMLQLYVWLGSGGERPRFVRAD